MSNEYLRVVTSFASFYSYVPRRLADNAAPAERDSPVELFYCSHFGHSLNIFEMAFCIISWFLFPLLLRVFCAIPRHIKL